jgi:hypothetical protein
MSHDITLPSGATVTLLDVDELDFGAREDVLSELNVDMDGNVLDIGGKVLVEFQRALIKMAVTGWTCTGRDGALLPLPSQDPTAIRRLKARDGNALFKAIEPLKDELFADFDVAPEPSPTGPSGD